jgi:hypothetical protein
MRYFPGSGTTLEEISFMDTKATPSALPLHMIEERNKSVHSKEERLRSPPETRSNPRKVLPFAYNF